MCFSTKKLPKGGGLTLLLMVLLSFVSPKVFSQNYDNFSKINFYGGLDWLNRSKHVDYDKANSKGWNGGLSYDRYWGRLGLGLDLDYTKNKKVIYDTTGLSGITNSTFFSTSSNGTERISAFIGPMFRQQLFENMYLELGLKGGASRIVGGDLLAKIVNGLIYQDLGYTKNTYLPAIKSTLRLNYRPFNRIGFFVQGDYLYYLKSANVVNYYKRNDATPLNYSYEINSKRVSGGLSYYFGGSNNTEPIKKELTNVEPAKVPVKKEEINPREQKSIKVELADDQTGFRLYNAYVTLTDANGKTYTAKTDKAGVAVFDSVRKGRYTVTSVLNGIKSTGDKIYTGDFDNDDKEMTVGLKHSDPRFTLIGFTTNKTNGSREPDVEVKLQNKVNQNETVVMSKEGTGEFLFQLAPNSEYKLYGKKNSYISNIENISTKGLDRSTTLYVLLELGVEEAKVNKVIGLNNIYYDLDKAEIRQDASTDLHKLLQFLRDNPMSKIELSSHTDSRGSNDYNLRLSYNRAKNVVDYLISSGINKARITAVGYGEERLINHCSDGVECSEAEHQKNRRTEFKVVK